MEVAEEKFQACLVELERLHCEVLFTEVAKQQPNIVNLLLNFRRAWSECFGPADEAMYWEVLCRQNAADIERAAPLTPVIRRRGCG